MRRNRRKKNLLFAILLVAVIVVAGACTSAGSAAEPYGEEKTEAPETNAAEEATTAADDAEVPETEAAEEAATAADDTEGPEMNTAEESAAAADSAAETSAPSAYTEPAEEDAAAAEADPTEETGRKYIFIGDSRTCCIANAVHGTDAWTMGSMVCCWFGEDYFSCQFGAHLWESDYAIVNGAINMIQDNTSIFLLMGRNDVNEPQDLFAEDYNRILAEMVSIAATKKNAQVYFVTVGPDQGYDATQFKIFNDAVGCEGVIKLDPWDSIAPITYQTDILGDLHYSNETSQKLYDWLKDAARKHSAAQAAAVFAVRQVRARIQRA